MKRHILVTSLVVNVWIAVGGLAFSGCNQSLTSAPSPSGAHKSNAPGTGGANSGDSASDADTPQDSSCPQDASGDASGALDDSSLPRDFPDVEMDALPPAASVPVCSTMVSFARSKVLLELGPLGTILGSVTPDELTVAWTIPGSFSPGGSLPPSVRVADRDASDSEFGSPQTVDMGTLSIGQDKVALSPDGLRLVAVRADLQGFVELRRPDRSSAFSSPSEDDYIDINNSIGGTGDALGSPTLAPDDKSFFFTRAQTVQESRRTANVPWPVAAPVTIENRLDSSRQLRPTGVSQDLLTLFVWDDERSLEIAAWRLYPTEHFESTVRIGPNPSAQPNSGCRELYFATTGDDGNVYLAQAHGSYSP